MKVRKEDIESFFRQHPHGATEFRDLVRLFGISKAFRSHFKDLLDVLFDEGRIRKVRGNRYAAVSGATLIAGRLSTHPDGYGFVTPDEGGEDIFIPARFLRENLHGDRVEVSVVSHGRGGKREGRVLRTVEHTVTKIVGRFERRGKTCSVVPDDQRIARALFIPSHATARAESGQIVVAEITAYPSLRQRTEGKVVELLGWPDDPGVESLAIIRKYELPDTFSQAVLATAIKVPQTVSDADRRGRIDLRGYRTVTIDGETARDFDDAVSIQRESDGNFRLRVSIADVSHYVKPGTSLDAEAYQRGTSVYFPERCIPMLPEELSNGVCSLNQGVDRLTVTVEIVFDASGKQVKADFYPSVIRSSGRLTYTAVKQILVDKNREVTEAWSHLLDDLTLMEDLASKLMARRRERGSIDFDLPEPEIILDLQGQTEAIIRAERTIAHRIIEEFMLAANEAVACFIDDQGVPSLYRVHESPDMAKLVDFNELVTSFGYEFRFLGETVEPGEFQRLLDAAAGKPEERLINGMLLRSMKQARYSAENLGHFGLAAPCYTHFTSPIRRYPDLVVHRILKDILCRKVAGKTREELAETLSEIARHSSKRERLAMDAEREIVLLKKIQFMRSRVGEDFDGFISGVSPHGIFVELADMFVEGMIHVATLPSDYYRFVEKQHLLVGEYGNRLFRMGDGIRVKVAQVSTERKQIDFVLSDSEDGIPPVRPETVSRAVKKGGRHQGTERMKGAGRKKGTGRSKRR